MKYLGPISSTIITYIMALLGMAFYTLLERKVLGYIQLRKGPNKVSISGLPQPIADAMKLFLKEQSKPKLANLYLFILMPSISLFLALSLWSLYPHPFMSAFIPMSVIMFLCISSMNVYITLAAGWSSNSKYALLGALRSVAQTISYEVSMILILLSPLICSSSLSLFQISYSQNFIPMLLFPMLFFSWFITILAETNRSPFDFAEGESELVSGFNTEYSSGTFALLFMAEYTSIIIMSLITSSIFLSTPSSHAYIFPQILSIKTMICAFLFLWIRGSLPRMRYDKLMSLTWKILLPFSISSLVFITPLIFLQY
uniref:NADH dehydrogenase subunit 1 n=1 Tax=Diopatra cuprea TaxID=398472 RepID=UPI001D0FD4A5|nr:NADH dehydrogenase subunit 1 [Diopatra cuprea]QZM06617.1 NADH dehydrogenase subunit 1 [Diopatra cuprea]